MPSPQPAPKTTGSRWHYSRYAEDEPTIPVRRSTIIFAAVALVVLLFIAYAIGKRSAAPSAPSRADQPTQLDSGVLHSQRPALPAELKDHFVIHVKNFDHTQTAAEANARAYEDFLNTDPATAFLRQYGKKVYILSYDQELLVCVGPFDGENDATARTVRSQLQDVRRNGLLQFPRADLIKAPEYARLFDERGDTR